MPRRIYTYQPELGWDPLNLLATVGALIIFCGGILFIGNVFWALRKGQLAADNPWGAGTLEWSTSSPPPSYNFLQLPLVCGRYALWASDELSVITGLRTDRREVLVTNLLDAEPDFRYELPGPSIWPILTALAVTLGFIGSLFNPWWLVPSAALSFMTFVGWFWPSQVRS
jgi:cytochrome c oxidase subunit 1